MNKMRTLLLSGIVLCGGTGLLNAQQPNGKVLLHDEFLTTDLWTTDITTTFRWSEKGDQVSGFELAKTTDLNGLTKQCVRITQEALSKPGYKPGTMLAGLAFDYRFQTPVDHGQTNLKIEFDALWDAVKNSGWGESGRLVLTLLHDYPDDSIPYNSILDIKKTAPFGRPAYNLRIRNHEKTGSYYSGAFMLYGGGMDREGEIEKYNNQYWLPGFSSEAGGTSPGLLAAYPLSPTMKNESMATVAFPFWKHYTWLVMPERMEFYMRDSNQSESSNQLVFFMQIPKTTKTNNEIIQEINYAHQSSITSLPHLYNWFPTFEALRIYFRGEQQTNLANLKITAQNVSTSAITSFRQKTKVQVQPNPSTGNFRIVLHDEHEFEFLSLFNANGSKVYQQNLDQKSNNYNLQLSGIPSGVYLLRLEGKSQTETVRVIIQ